MSILKELEGYVDLVCSKINMNIQDVRMLELGNQRMGTWDRPDYYKAYKIVMEERGIKEHISIDLTGENGALILNLGEPINQWNNYFDIVTNFGTAEHVNNQYWVWKNMHNMCKIGGAILSCNPPVGDWPKHCPFRYRNDFFDILSTNNKYTIAHQETITVSNPNPRKNRKLLVAILIKTNNEFMSENDFLNMKTIHGLPSYKEI